MNPPWKLILTLFLKNQKIKITSDSLSSSASFNQVKNGSAFLWICSDRSLLTYFLLTWKKYNEIMIKINQCNFTHLFLKSNFFCQSWTEIGWFDWLLIKDSLNSESFWYWLVSQKNVPNTNPEHLFRWIEVRNQDSGLAHFWGDSQFRRFAFGYLISYF